MVEPTNVFEDFFIIRNNLLLLNANEQYGNWNLLSSKESFNNNAMNLNFKKMDDEHF